jgi:DNA-binding response OmpR family regulator
MSQPPRVLVVDDELPMREYLALGLREHGFAVHTVGDGAAAMHELDVRKPDLIVLDVMLPKVDGIMLLPEFRRKSEVPILMLSASSDLEVRIAGLQGGADDYLGKPFALSELVGRLHALLRRPNLVRANVLTFGELSIDLDRRTVTRAKEIFDFSVREFDLLTTLVRHRGKVYSRGQLLERVWGSEREIQPGTVDTYVSYLRAKLERPPHRRIIHTVRGIGYMAR